MTSKQFQPERLSRLAYHLIRHQKTLKKNSCIYVPALSEKDDVINETMPYFMYTILELVKVFPKEWHMKKNGQAHWIYDRKKSLFSSVIDFFGLHSSAFCHIFIPGGQNIALFGGKLLSVNASPKQIAENILELINVLEIQKN